MHKDHYDDAHMLCKVLDSTAAQALELKKKIEQGHQLPSWAEYKVYKAGDSVKSALSSTYSMSDKLHGSMPVSVAMHKIAGLKSTMKPLGRTFLKLQKKSPSPIMGPRRDPKFLTESPVWNNLSSKDKVKFRMWARGRDKFGGKRGPGVTMAKEDLRINNKKALDQKASDPGWAWDY